MKQILVAAFFLVSVLCGEPLVAAEPARVLIVVGPTDHPPRTHEVAAGGRVLKDCLEAMPDLASFNPANIEPQPRPKKAGAK